MGKLLLALVMAGVVLALGGATPAAADPATVTPVATPTGTYYVVSHGTGHAPSVHPTGGLCAFTPVGSACTPDVSWSGYAQVWEESNGCQGLQRSATTCPETGASVGPDTRHPW